MARSIRIEFAGAFYHVMARGNRRESIFYDEGDRQFFLKTLGEACGRTGWKVHAWVLMNNHYHMLLETPEANLVDGMKWLQTTFTRRINTKHGLWGRVFGDRYKSVLVEGENPDYFTTLLDYIHLNPARAGAVDFAGGGSVLDYPWSSLRMAYAELNAKKYPWSCVEMGLGAFGFENTSAGRREFVERLERRAREEAQAAGLVEIPPERDARWSHLRRGWFWGSREFAQKSLELAKNLIGSRKNPTYRSGLVHRAHDLEEAERIVREGLVVLGIGEADLETRRSSDPAKVVLARAIRAKTSVQLAWIAQRLKMGSASYVSKQLGHAERAGTRKREILDQLNSKIVEIL